MSGFGENLLQDNLDQLANVAAAQADSQAPKIEEIDDKTEEEKVSEVNTLKVLSIGTDLIKQCRPKSDGSCKNYRYLQWNKFE